MGKITGFLEYERENGKALPPKERIKNWNEFHIPLSEEEQKLQGALAAGLRRSLLPVRHDDWRDGFRMSFKQSDSGME